MVNEELEVAPAWCRENNKEGIRLKKFNRLNKKRRLKRLRKKRRKYLAEKAKYKV
ncbi:hypothetical protein ES708_07465 [subsurface metagenome]